MFNPKISILLPSRERKKTLLRCLNSLLKNAQNQKNIEVILIFDEDDISSHSIDFEGFCLKKLILKRTNMGVYLSKALKVARGEIIISMNDDIVVKTPEWDKIIIETHYKFKDQIYLAYPNDLFKKKKQCTTPILSKKICKIIDPFPNLYKGAFIDTHLMDIFKRLEKSNFDRLLFLENLIFKHEHYRVTGKDPDKTYLSRDRFGDDINFCELSYKRMTDSYKLMNLISEKKISNKSLFKKKKQMLYFLFSNFFDKELPFMWRFNLSFSLLLRFVYKKYLQ